MSLLSSKDLSPSSGPLARIKVEARHRSRFLETFHREQPFVSCTLILDREDCRILVIPVISEGLMHPLIGCSRPLGPVQLLLLAT